MSDTPNEFPPPSIEFPFAYGAPSASADFRSQLTDFIVDEQLGFEPLGEGEHLLVRVRKRGDNTGWIAEQLAAYFGIRPMDVGFCGLKDRHAETSQWFSLYLPKSDPTDDEKRLQTFIDESEADLDLLTFGRHIKKLRRGQHTANAFQIILRNIREPDSLPARLSAIAEQGVPNYFGEQRFGRSSSNLHWARRWFEGGETIRSRNKKVMAKSAARSYLFNLVLGERVKLGNWCQLIDNDPKSLTGPLWGRGRPVVSEALASSEAQAMESCGQWLEGLEHVGLQQERRDLVLHPQHFTWTQEGDILTLRFALPPGAFATAVLRELATLVNCSAAPEVEA